MISSPVSLDVYSSLSSPIVLLMESIIYQVGVHTIFSKGSVGPANIHVLITSAQFKMLNL